MLALWPFLVALLVVLLILHFGKQLWSRRHYPPGPLPLPIIGSFHGLGIGLDENSLMKVAKKYGNIFTILVGNQPAIIMCGYQAVKEALINHGEYFDERPVYKFLDKLTHEKGIISSNGHTWRQQKRFAQVTMRKLGLGKKGIEHQIEEEAHQLVESMAHLKGQPFDPSLPITNSVANVICALAFGQRFDIDDKDFQHLVEAVKFILIYILSITNAIHELFPWLFKYLPGPHKKAFAFADSVRSFISKQVDEHKERQTLHDPQDFIDFYLLQMEKSKNDPNSTYNEENLAGSIFDLFFAGTDTTASSMLWALLLMAGHPDIQEKVQKEIEDVMGSSPSISYQDRKKLPYTNAVLHEIQRSHYAVLYGLPRQCSKDVNIFGYLIPKGAYVVTDLRSVLIDPKQWETPLEFNPKHFLSKDGNFVAREEFLPFGAGIRACVGEQLARIELFILFTSLLKVFTFKLPEGVKEINTKPVIGLSTHPRPYKICAVSRYSASHKP